MQRLSSGLRRVVPTLCFLFFAHNIAAQQLKLTDFAIWGGGSLPAPYNNAQGVFIENGGNVVGNIGSNHLVQVKNNLNVKGNIYSGNRVVFDNNATITGDISASRIGTNISPAISGGNNGAITGNLTANGPVNLRSGKVTGRVAVPAPANSNYSGPAPTGGVGSAFTLPDMPAMPNPTPFDNLVGTVTISGSQSISPGTFRKLSLNGSKTITFNGPGNYIFFEVDNGSSSNKLVFDFKNTTSGTINIFIIKDARWGALSVSTINGNFPARIYTEVHGNGASFAGNAFDLKAPGALPAGSHLWLGNVWAPSGGIAISNTVASSVPHIIGALWSGKKVAFKNDLRLQYAVPAADPSFVSPYYPPPASGKVGASNNMIGAELFSLFQNRSPITSITDNEIFIFDGMGNVMIEVVSKTAGDDQLKAELKSLGMIDTVNNGPHTFIITGFFPITNISLLNSNERIQYVRPLYPAISNGGQITTQGDTTMRSHNVRARFGVDGSGVKIGVISDSYNSKRSAQDDVDQGDLPGLRSNGQANENAEPVQVLADLPQRGNDEGRAMLQIVHDVAPKSKLAFRTGFLTAGDFARGIQELASPTLPGGRCDVIVDDITYITEPFLRDGIVAQTVNDVVSQGVTYFSSAGNFGTKSYEGIFNGITKTSLIPTGQIHQFGAGSEEIYQTVKLKPGSYTIVLQWNDEFHSLGSTDGVQTDMDLYLVGANGFTLFGFNRSNLFGDPFEVCPFTVKEETTAKLMVVRASGNTNVRFKFIILRGEAAMEDYQLGTSTIIGHPNAAGAIAVGAMLYKNIPGITSVWPGVASFSSRGGTLTTQSSGVVQRNKPELIGPNGVNTTVNLGGAPFNDGDPYPNFFGTSAAAPHVAAVGALLIEGRKKFNLQGTVTPAEIREDLVASAGKFSNLPGSFSFEGGYGYAQADSAIAQIANARPIISTLEPVVPGAQNGSEPFAVKIRGAYLTNNTVVYFAGRPITTTVSADKTEATATVPDIAPGQDPPLQLYNPPKSQSGLDGGLSEALHFFSNIVNITVRADNKSRKYGQDNPTFTAQVLYNGVVMTNPDTLAKLGLDGNNILYTTIATSSSNAGLYGIFPSRITPLAPNDPLLANYGFTFLSGTLSVGKMPLKITPNNKTVTYGQDLGEISYTYELDPASATTQQFRDGVANLHKKYLAANGLIVLNGFSSSTVTAADLANMSTMASFQSVRNARKYVLENGQLKAIVNNLAPALIDSQRFFVDVSAQSLEAYNEDSASTTLVEAGTAADPRGFLNVKALVTGTAEAALPNGQLKAMVNGQLMAMVNGQTLPLVNGQLMAMVNGQLEQVAEGQVLAIVNGQLMALINGELEAIQELTLVNGQLQALVNGQLKAIVNGQLKAMVNGVVTDIPTSDINLVNGQLQAIVNGQLQALVNGQLQALVNGQLKALVNGEALLTTSVKQLANGQLKAIVNGLEIPVTNGQLQALVNGQLLAMVNGQLMAIVNGELVFVVFANGQLKALVNGQLKAMVNGQLKAIVNGELTEVNSYTITDSDGVTNGQLKAIVNGEDWIYANGQLLALVNGQLKALVNNFDVGGSNNNSKTLVLVDGDDLELQSGAIGAMFSLNMITGMEAGVQQLIPGSFVNENFEVSYGISQIDILKAPVTVTAVDTTRIYGDPNPEFRLRYSGLATGEDADDIATPPVATTAATVDTNAGSYPILVSGGSSANYTFSYQPGTLNITKRPLLVTADNKTKTAGYENPPLTITYNGLAGDDTKDSICAPVVLPTSPVDIYQLNRITTYTDVRLNGGTNVIHATPGQQVTLTGTFNSVYFDPSDYCPGCITQLHIGLTDDIGRNVFNDCFDAAGGTGSLNRTFAAPTKPGFYYITQESTWWFFCGQFSDPAHLSGLVGAIALVIVDPPLVVPPSPRTIQQLNRATTYTDVKLNGETNIIEATPGQTITLTGAYNSIYSDPTNFCPGCITQIYIGMSGAPGSGVVFTDCYNVSGQASYSGTFNKTFNAPSVPGVYYITQVSSWQFNCYDSAYGNPANDPAGAMAVVVVKGLTVGIGASTIAETTSLPATYPILLQGCSTSSPNYEITLENGLLTVFANVAATNTVAGVTEEILSIPKKDKIFEDKIYPNPGSSIIRLELKDEVLRSGDIQVSDISGVMNRVGIKSLNGRSHDINVSALSRGVYFIKVKTVGGLKTFRFMKL